MTTKNLRETKQRNAIRNAFEVTGRPLGPKEVLDIAAKEFPNLGIATVYRNIKTMVEQGELQTIDLPGQPPRYDLPRQTVDNQSILMCEKTNRVFHANPQEVQINMPKIPGFNVNRYQIILYGESTDGTAQQVTANVTQA